jgi:alpha-tubulin suppressor-like RCC1 family protein
MSNIINSYGILRNFDEEIVQNIKIFSIFGTNGSDVIVVTKGDKVYSFGNNSNGCLGFDHRNPIEKPKLINELSGKEIVNFSCGYRHVIAISKNNTLYSWGQNDCGQMGDGTTNESSNKPKIINKLCDKNIIDISCGYAYSLALSNSGEVYAWGSNTCGQIGIGSAERYFTSPQKINVLDKESIVSISCGGEHSLALSKSGNVFNWGFNAGKVPKMIVTENNIIVQKIICGRDHSLLLSNEGFVYAFGRNRFGQLGEGSEVFRTKPTKINDSNKFCDIVSHFSYNASFAKSVDDVYYEWGECGQEVILNPRKTEFNSFIDIFAKYYHKTHRTLRIEDFSAKKMNDEKSVENLIENLKFTPDGRYEYDFEEIEAIGRGSFGSVFKVRNRFDEQFYAMKKINLKG